MKSFFAAASLAATASAAALRRGDMASCGFQIISSGGVNGVMGQFEDGQNRINGSYAPATYYYNNGGIVDEAGRGCIVTLTNDATHQFQCDLNKPPTYGFTIAQNGSILYHGSDQFYACPYITEYNIYTQWLKGQDKCVQIKLSTNSTCAAGSYPTGTAASYYPTGAAGTGVPVVPGYSSEAPPYPSSAGQSVPGYGESTVPYVSQSTPAGSAPGYSQGTVPAGTAPSYSQATVPGYGGGSGSLPSASVPYSSVESSPVESTSVPVVPGYGAGSSQASVPGYGSGFTSAVTQPAGSTSIPVVPGYGGSSSASVSSPVETSPVQSTSVPVVPGHGGQSSASVSSPVETSPIQSTVQVPGYGSQASVPQYSSETTPAVSTPEESSPAESTPVQSVPVPTTASSPSAQSTIMILTTVITSNCPETETAVSSGTTVYNTYETQSVITSVATSSLSVPAETPSSSVASVSTPSPEQSTTSVVESQSQTTQVPVPSYPASSSESESVPASTESVPQQTTPSVPATSEVESTTCTEEVSSTGVPSISTPSVPPTPPSPASSESTTCTEEASTSAPTTFATTWSAPAGNNSVPAPTGSASYTQSYSQPWGSGSSSIPSGTQPAGYGSTTSAPSSTVPATSTTASACQTSLEGAYQTPHLITWIAKDYPDNSYGSKYNATVNEDCSTLMNFDIPSDYAGKTCSVVFLFPKQEDLETSAWSWNNQGGIQFDSLSSAASESTTYNTAPATNGTLNTVDIQAGNSYVVSTAACQAGTTQSFELSSSNGLQLEFFEDWNPSSLGLYVTAC